MRNRSTRSSPPPTPTSASWPRCSDSVRAPWSVIIPKAGSRRVAGCARAMTADPPWDDYYGPGSPLARLVEANGQVAAPRRRSRHRHPDPLRREPGADVGQAAGPSPPPGATPRGPEVFVVDTLDDSNGIVDHPGEDYFITILTAYLQTGRARTSTVGQAHSELIVATEFVRFAIDWMLEHF